MAVVKGSAIIPFCVVFVLDHSLVCSQEKDPNWNAF